MQAVRELAWDGNNTNIAFGDNHWLLRRVVPGFYAHQRHEDQAASGSIPDVSCFHSKMNYCRFKFGTKRRFGNLLIVLEIAVGRLDDRYSNGFSYNTACRDSSR
jgi:hypothetical protein